MACRVALLAAVLSAAVVLPAAAATSTTSLRITVWPDGKDSGSKSWTLRCNPLGGTLPRRLNACRRLAVLRTPFAPVPPDAACTDIYGGPAVAYVRGTLRGRRVSAWFNRKDGCEIDRWSRVGVLFPVGTSATR